MKAFDYDAVVYDGKVYCTQCLPEGVDDDDCNPIFADSEVDSAPSCSECGEVHDYMSVLNYESLVNDEGEEGEDEWNDRQISR